MITRYRWCTVRGHRRTSKCRVRVRLVDLVFVTTFWSASRWIATYFPRRSLTFNRYSSVPGLSNLHPDAITRRIPEYRHAGRLIGLARCAAGEVNDDGQAASRTESTGVAGADFHMAEPDSAELKFTMAEVP